MYHFRGRGLPTRIDGLVGGPLPSEEEQTDLKKRWKKLGSSLSTVRMVTRIGDFLE